ncbi:hypothetical protein HBI55_170800 [Parastagonospora nodorum]|nr:hypothetical protein HBI55_170800 [Parastagonospora nodorum]
MYRSSFYASTIKLPRSPHPHALPRQLDFLEDFDSDGGLYRQGSRQESRDFTDTEDDDENIADVKREYELLIRRGWTYSVAMVVTTIFLAKVCPLSGLAAVTLLFLVTYPQSDVYYAIGDLLPWSKVPEDVKTALHRRPSFIYVHNSQAARAGIHPDMDPHRRFEESLTHAARLVMRQLSESIKSIVSYTLRYILLQAGLQLHVTIAQHLGALFRAGEDVTGFFPRYVANMMSMQNLFRPDGFADFTSNRVSTIKWWYGWISSLTRDLILYLPKYLVTGFGRLLVKSVAILEGIVASEHLAEDVKEKIQQFLG